MPAAPSRARLARLLKDYVELTDVVDGRVLETAAPHWCQRRGLTEYLLGLDDAQLLVAETQGLYRALPNLPVAPTELSRICQIAQQQVAEWACFVPEETALETRNVGAKKRVQVASFVAQAMRHVPRPKRIVDVGSGLGHLTRAIAAAMQVQTLGVEVEPARCRRASSLAGSAIVFDALDANAVKVVSQGDFAVGLHACGDLGDAILRQARDVRAHVMLVSCCMQKVRNSPRQALSTIGQRAGLSFSKPALGLSNLSSWEQKDKMDQIHQGRRTRQALRELLRARGVAVQMGEETHGVHRRKFRRGLLAVANLACAHRGLPAPTTDEVAHFEALGVAQYEVIRRLELPRSMLGRIVECAIALDRACFLEEADYVVELGVLVPSAVTPRNLAIIARA